MEIKLVDGHNRIVFSQEDKDKIYDLFVNQGYSMRKISREFKIGHWKRVKEVLDEMNIDSSRGNLTSYKYYFDEIFDEEFQNKVIDKIQSIPSKQQKYNINDYYFDDINNPEVVYTIGLLYADGCNHEYSINICLEEQDGFLLKKINQNMQNEKPVNFLDKSNKHDFGYTYKNQYSLNIFNKRITSVLNELGVVPNKSLILEFPKWLSPNLYSHFIRGVFDGDGSLYRYYENGIPRNTVVTITSTENFCKALSDILAKYVGIRGHIYDASCHNGITRVLSLCGYNVCQKFLEWIYSDATIFLNRKYKRYCEYYNINNSLIA